MDVFQTKILQPEKKSLTLRWSSSKCIRKTHIHLEVEYLGAFSRRCIGYEDDQRVITSVLLSARPRIRCSDELVLVQRIFELVDTRLCRVPFYTWVKYILYDGNFKT